MTERPPVWPPMPEPQPWTPPKRRDPWVVAGLIVGGLLLAVIVLVVAADRRGDDVPARFGHITTERYEQIRAACQAEATSRVAGTNYRVGGGHWVDMVNDCMLDLARD